MDETTVAAPEPESLGSAIDRLFDLNQRLKRVGQVEKRIKEQIEELEQSVMGALDAQDSVLGSGHRGKATITESVVPNLEDLDALWEYMKENDAPYLLERRVALTAWRELFQQGTLVPGTRSFVKRKVSVKRL